MGGSPNWFRCHNERRERRAYDYIDKAITPQHKIRLTGRTRPNPSKSRSLRVDDVEREYACTCGHVGWSRLNDVVRRATRDAHNATPGLLPCPDGGVCHHGCTTGCFRVSYCGPLFGVFPGDRWPPVVVSQHVRRSEP